jgi:hypothetical protein
MTYDEVELALLALPADASVLVAEQTASRIDKDVDTIAAQHRIIRFNGRLMIEVYEPYPHFSLFTKVHYNRIAYPLLGAVKKSHINEIFWHLSRIAPDLNGNDHILLFGSLRSPRAHLTVWDMDALEVRSDIAPDDCVRRSPYPMKGSGNEPVSFIMQLAGNKQSLYDDIMQSLAPLVMAKKPDGVIWWVGGDNDGKTTLIEALRRIFPEQLASLTIQQLNGRRRTLGLNDKLGNIAADGEAQIKDAEIYKSIGTHRSFSTHLYHSQNGIEVQGNVHHIFSANSAPTFTTIDESILRRTQVVPFEQRFESYPVHAPTSEFCSRLIAEMCRYAVRIKQQGYLYSWSAATVAVKDKSYPGGKQAAYEALNLNKPKPAPLEFRW